MTHPAGEDFMGVGLVADVPKQPPFAEVVAVMQGDRQLHRAEVGREVAAVRVNGLLTGVEVPAGEHSVVLEYWDTLVSKSAMTSAAGVVLALGLLFLRRR